VHPSVNTQNTIETLHRIIVEKLAGSELAETSLINKTNGIGQIGHELVGLNELLQKSGGRAATTEEFINHCLLTTSNRLMHVVQNLNYGICVCDENNNLVFINQRFCDLFNCPIDPIEFIGKPCPLMTDEVSNMFRFPEAIENGHRQLMKEREPVRGVQVELANGRMLLRDYCPIWNKNYFLGQVWIFEDITNRIATEVKLEEQRKFYEDVLDKIPTDLVVFNTKREYLFANETAIRDPHVRKWLIGKRDEDYFRLRQFPAEMLANRVRILEEVLNTAEQRKWEEKFILKDGSIQYQLRCLYPVFDEAGQLKLLIGYGFDISEQKRIEEQIQRSEKRYRDLFNYSEALICTHDLTGRMLSVNPAICRLLEFTEDEMVGRLISDFVPPENVENFQSLYLDPLMRDGKCKGVFCVISKSGQRIFLLYKNYKVEEDDLEPYIIGFSQDITDRVESEKQLLLAKKITEETSRAKEVFLANMSHEIRTPMNGVLGFASLLVKTDLSEQQRGYLTMIQESANNLLVIVNDVLDLEKILMGKLKFEHIDFLIAERIEMCVQTFTYKAEEKGIVLQSSVSLKNDVTVIGDPHRLGQVLNNLISNAIKFTDKGSVTITAKIHETSDSLLWLEFAVVDTGIGIPVDKHSEVFEPFMQANTAVTRQYGGTGLGLSICRELIQLMGGKLFLESEPGKGSTFRFLLPFGISIYKPKNKNMSQEINYQSLGKKRILVAEDVELNQYLARHIMESWGFEVDIAVNGKEALRKVQESEYDLVLMDIQMPEMDGMQATQNIRALENRKIACIPIVALTANALKGDSEKYMAVGMNDYLSKPFDEPRLFQVIAKNLELAKSQNAQSNDIGSGEISTNAGITTTADSSTNANATLANAEAGLAIAKATPAIAEAGSAVAKSIPANADDGSSVVKATSANAEAGSPNPETRSGYTEASLITKGPAKIIINPGEKLYNLSMVEAISGGDQDFVKRMVQLFLDTMPEALKDIESATGDQRWEALSKLAHKLKSTIDSMGIERLKQLVRTIESNGKTGTDTGQIPALVETLVATMRICMDQIKTDYSL
jgi:PAS domain S-box-containing protein